MYSVLKSMIAVAAVACVAMAGQIETARAQACVGCNVPISQTNVRTIYRTRVVHQYRDVTRVRNITRIRYVHRAAAPQRFRLASLLHWDNRPGRHLVWPGCQQYTFSCDSRR